jgi:hypothetical protein
MVTKLSELADFLEERSIPQWFRDVVERDRETILAELYRHGEYKLEGPNGEVITIKMKDDALVGASAA